MCEYVKINEEPIDIEYVEDEHEESRDFAPSFWLAAAGYNKRYYLEDFMRVHNNPWYPYELPSYIHGIETENYYNPIYIELIGDCQVNVYEGKESD